MGHAVAPRRSRLGGGIGMRLGVADAEAGERGAAWAFRPSDGRLSIHADATEEGTKGDPLMEGDLQNRAMGVRVEVVVDMRLRALGFSIDGGRMYDASVQLPATVRPMARLFYRGDAVSLSGYAYYNPTLLSLQLPRLSGEAPRSRSPGSCSPRSASPGRGAPRSVTPTPGRSGSPAARRATSRASELEASLRRELAEERRLSASLRKRVEELEQVSSLTRTHALACFAHRTPPRQGCPLPAAALTRVSSPPTAAGELGATGARADAHRVAAREHGAAARCELMCSRGLGVVCAQKARASWCIMLSPRVVGRTSDVV